MAIEKTSVTVILDSPGVYEVVENADERFPCTLYFYMPKDPSFTSQVLRNAKLMKAKGVNVEHIPMYEFPVTPDLFSLRNPCISKETSARIFRALLEAKFLDEDHLLRISTWDFDYNSWIEDNNLISQCKLHNSCLSKHVVQELNVAFAYHFMSSRKNDAMFKWFESSLELQGANPEARLSF